MAVAFWWFFSWFSGSLGIFPPQQKLLVDGSLVVVPSKAHTSKTESQCCLGLPWAGRVRPLQHEGGVATARIEGGIPVEDLGYILILDA